MWGKKNQYEVLKIENKGRGPFIPLRGCKTFYVTIKNEERNIKELWFQYQGIIPLTPRIEGVEKEK